MNEPFRIIRNSSLSAVTFFVTILGLSYGYASLNSGLTLSDRTSSGSLLSAGVWNKLVESVVELDSRTATLSSSGGNLGVGTINPGRTVHVYKSTNVDMTLDQDAPSGVSWLYFGNDTNDNNAKAAIGLGWSTYGSYGGGNSLNVWNSFNAPIAFSQNNTEAMRIATGGNLWVGTNAPAQKLSVNGSIQFCWGALGSSGKVTLSGYSGPTCPAGWITLMTQSNLALCGKVEAGCP